MAIYENRAERDYRFADTLSSRRRRAELRRQIQAEDLDIPPSQVETMVRIRMAASLGGRMRAQKLSPARRRAIAKRAARARWRKS